MRIKLKTDGRSFQTGAIDTGTRFWLARIQQPSKKEVRYQICTRWKVYSKGWKWQSFFLFAPPPPLWHHWRQWRSDIRTLLTNGKVMTLLLATSYSWVLNIEYKEKCNLNRKILSDPLLSFFLLFFFMLFFAHIGKALGEYFGNLVNWFAIRCFQLSFWFSFVFRHTLNDKQNPTSLCIIFSWKDNPFCLATKDDVHVC